MRINETIDGRRKALGMSVSELSRAADINYEALRVSLAGHRKINASEFLALCKVLGLTLEDFGSISLDDGLV